MKFIPLVYSPYYSYDFSDQHRFPMAKFRLLHAFLCKQAIATPNNLFRPGVARADILELAHCRDYLKRLNAGRLTKKEIRRLGLPWSSELLKRSLISPNGTLLAANLALRQGIACHLAGGTHHAHHDFASGYCMLNDLAIASIALLKQAKIQRILIFDCDVHQGDGTATILQNFPDITTCSIHCEKNFPYRKAQSDIDIDVPPHAKDDEYLKIVEQTLKAAIDSARPDLVLYDAGVDIYEHDPLGLLNISLDGIRQRDAHVIKTVRQANIPLATVIGGGYDQDQVALAKRHAIVVEEADRYIKENQDV